MVAAASARDDHFMRRALFHAARGQGQTTPNPLVGAVVVSPDDVVVGQGYHLRAGEAHAEVIALDEAGVRARGATLYVTLEPCCHTGRTGPCTRRIMAAGVSRVVTAMEDPDPRVSGQGVAELRAHGIAVEVSVGEAAAQRLNAAFVLSTRERRPLVVLKAATSLDGRIAARPGHRTAISGPAAERRTHRLRASVDAIAVGSETMLVDDPLLTARWCARTRPLTRVIFDRRLRTPARARVFSTLDAGPVVIATSPPASAERSVDGPVSTRESFAGWNIREQALRAAGATIIAASSLRAQLTALHEAGVSSLLVEGGAALHAAFVEAGLADRLHLIVSPQSLGCHGVPWLDVNTLPVNALSPGSAEPCGRDIWIEADVHRNR